MADTIIEVTLHANAITDSFSLRMIDPDTDTIVLSVATVALTQMTNDNRKFRFTHSGSETGIHSINVLNSLGESVGGQYVNIEADDDSVYRSFGWYNGSSSLSSEDIAGLISSAIVTAGVKISPQGFPSRLFRGDQRSDENGSAILIKLFDDDDPPNVITGVGTLNFSDAGCVGAVGLRRPDSSVADVTLSAEWDAVGEQWKVEYGETALDDFPDGNNVLAEWALTIDWSGSNRISPADGTTRIVNKFTA